MNIKSLALIFSILGTLVLYYFSLLNQPICIDLDQISEHDGKLVKTNGIVCNYYSTKYGSMFIEIKDNESIGTVFLEEAFDVEYGDNISVIGNVQKYQDTWEIIVENLDDIYIISKWSNISFPVWQLAANPSRYLDMNVNVTGIVDSVFDNYFYLKDLEEDVVLFVSAYTDSFVNHGKIVSISGKFLFDQKSLQYKLLVCEENHGIFLNTGE